MKDQSDALASLVIEIAGSDLAGLYLYGSATAGGLKPASDLDFLAVTDRPISDEQRHRLIAGLRPISARALRPAGWRPIELTIVAQSDIVPWAYPPRLDFQSGEWLRAALDAGDPQPWLSPNPDLAIVIAQVRLTGQALVGKPASHLLPKIPTADLRRAMTDEIDALLADLATDTANVLLTLARIWYTLSTGKFESKDTAADWAVAQLPNSGRAALERARDAYLGRGPGSWQEQDAWAGLLAEAESAASLLVAQIGRQSTLATIESDDEQVPRRRDLRDPDPDRL